MLIVLDERMEFVFKTISYSCPSLQSLDLMCSQYKVSSSSSSSHHHHYYYFYCIIVIIITIITMIISIIIIRFLIGVVKTSDLSLHPSSAPFLTAGIILIFIITVIVIIINTMSITIISSSSSSLKGHRQSTDYHQGTKTNELQGGPDGLHQFEY